MKACVFRPKNDEHNSVLLFDLIRTKINSITSKDVLGKQLSYTTTWNLYGLAMSNKFREDNKNNLQFDSKGFPTFKSLINTSYAKDLLGKDLKNKLYQTSFLPRDNTRDNYTLALLDALSFNKKHKTSVAYVLLNASNKLVVKVDENTALNFNKFKEQYATDVINHKITSILEPLGIKIGDLSDEEAKHLNGKTDFSVAMNIAKDTDSLIKVAKGILGSNAISEEFSHVIIAMKSPLKDRIIALLANNEEALKTILGEANYTNILESYQGENTLVAEEALGKLLLKHLIDSLIDRTFDNHSHKFSSIKTLFNRLRDFIVNKFKGKALNTVPNILNEANNMVSDLANLILNNKLNVTKKDIQETQRDVLLNLLSDLLTRNMEVLKKAIEIERKRFVITSNEDKKTEINKLLDDLSKGLLPNADSMLTVFEYLYYTNQLLKNLNYSLKNFNTLDIKEKFKTLRRIRSYIYSYKPIIEMLYKISTLNDEDSDANAMDTVFEYEGLKVSLNSALKDLNSLISTLEGQYKRLVVPAFALFLKPFIGEVKDNNGNIMNIEDMIKSLFGDISLMDRWLDSMGDSNDLLLQSMDTVLKVQKDKARLKSLSDIRKILTLMIKAKNMGITSFEFMFEHYNNGKKTGTYISDINKSLFIKDLLDENKYLDEKYGINNKDKSQREAKREEKKKWLNSHALYNILGGLEPDSTIYHNKEYDRLSNNLKLILNEYLALKATFDNNYPLDKVRGNAILIRRDSTLRFIDIAKDPTSIFTNVKEAWNKAWHTLEDDDLTNGKKSTLIDFDGRLFNSLPILYLSKIKNPDELSTDVFSSLVAYAISSNEYSAVSDVVDALEVGRTIVTDGIRQTTLTEGGKSLTERLNVKGSKSEKEVIKHNTLALEKLDEWFESLVYKRYYANEGETSIFGHKVSATKIGSLVSKFTSTCQLAFNYLSGMANVATGVAMTNIEAAAHEFFNAKDLASADKEYFSMLPSFMAELNSRVKSSKLSLFDDLFNVKFNFDSKGKQTMRSSIAARIFGKNISMLQLEGGDHWLYNRIAIAMAKNTKVLVHENGNQVQKSLWEVLKVVPSKENKDIKELVLPEGTLNLDGSDFSIGKFSRKIGEVCSTLFGNYNDDDRNAALRYTMGRLMLMYRQWIKPLFNRRFQSKLYNQALGTYEEGYYRTMCKIIAEYKLGALNLPKVWKTLDKTLKSNVIRGLVEMSLCLAVWALANLIEWPDDKNRPWAMKLAEYMAKREVHELGNLTPSLIMVRELSSTIKSPTAAISLVDNTCGFFSSVLSPSNYTNTLESGPYEGHSTLYKNFTKLPIPVLLYYHLIDKFTGKIDNSIDYYARTLSN